MSFFDQFYRGVNGKPKHLFSRRKFGRKHRLIGAPNEAMRTLQKNVLTYLSSIAPLLPSASARKGGRGSIGNVEYHRYAQEIYVTDLVDAFSCVDTMRLCEIICERVRRRFPKTETPTTIEWYTFLAPICFLYSGGLIQGSCISPLLFDWYCEMVIDRPVRSLLNRERAKNGVTILYTRYVDDLTFSSSRRVSRNMRKLLRFQLRLAGFTLNEGRKKTQHINFLKQSKSVLVTGMRIGPHGYCALPRKYVRQVYQKLCRAFYEGQDEYSGGHTRDELYGFLRYVLHGIQAKKEALSRPERDLLLIGRKWCVVNKISIAAFAEFV